MLIACDGGPSNSRLIHWPAPLEIPERGGLYVLQDTGPVEEWTYLWVPIAPQ
jgi:hypothetical protein